MRQPSSEEPAPPPAPPGAPAYGFASPASLIPPAASAPAPPQQGLLHKLIPQRRARAASEPQVAEQPAAEESWRRVALAAGVELHIREPIASALRERVERLIALARELLGD